MNLHREDAWAGIHPTPGGTTLSVNDERKAPLCLLRKVTGAPPSTTPRGAVHGGR